MAINVTVEMLYGLNFYVFLSSLGFAYTYFPDFKAIKLSCVWLGFFIEKYGLGLNITSDAGFLIFKCCVLFVLDILRSRNDVMIAMESVNCYQVGMNVWQPSLLCWAYMTYL